MSWTPTNEPSVEEIERRQKEAIRLNVLQARIAKLEDALRKVRPLLQDIMDIHRDPEDGEYHECDTDPCAWCVEAKELVEKPSLAVQQKGEGNDD